MSLKFPYSNNNCDVVMTDDSINGCDTFTGHMALENEFYGTPNIFSSRIDIQQPFDKSECYSSSSSSESNYSNLANKEEEAMVLASARPKKRAGRRVFKETRHPVYRGVRRRNNNKWVCEVRVPNHKSKRIWLGTYTTPEMAARAHDVAALTLKGKSACLNFADSAWRMPALSASASAEEIRRVAAEAVEAISIEDSHKSQSLNAVNDYEASSSSSNNIADAFQDGNKAFHGLHVDLGENEGLLEFDKDNVHDWVQSMADEPLRSPLHCVRYGMEWTDLDLDAEVSLWSFTI